MSEKNRDRLIIFGILAIAILLWLGWPRGGVAGAQQYFAPPGVTLNRPGIPGVVRTTPPIWQPPSRRGCGCGCSSDQFASVGLANYPPQILAAQMGVF